MLNAYERSTEVLDPAEFAEAVIELHKLSRKLESALGADQVEKAANYYKLQRKVIDSYINMWKTTTD
jgi:hypothetical protein